MSPNQRTYVPQVQIFQDQLNDRHTKSVNLNCEDVLMNATQKKN